MRVESLSIRTDLMFARLLGEVIERSDYLVIRTPSNPGFHWGNYLVFSRPPECGDDRLWPLIFREEFADLPDVKHLTMTWDMQSKGDHIQKFVEAGYTFESSKILTAKQVHAPQKFNHDITVQVVADNTGWEQVTQEHLLCNETYEPRSFEVFKRGQMANYRKMTNAGMGHWFGAYLGDQLVADLGVFFEGRVGRFQSVVTHPAYRRRGICGRLVYEAATYAFAQFGVESLVMVADENYHAAAIYESVGFVPTQTNYSLAWWRD